MLSLTNTDTGSKANPSNNLMMRRAGLSNEKVPKFWPRYNLDTLPGKICTKPQQIFAIGFYLAADNVFETKLK